MKLFHRAGGLLLAPLLALAFASAIRAEPVAAPSGAVPQQAIAYGAVGSTATPITLATPMPIGGGVAAGAAEDASGPVKMGCVLASAYTNGTAGNRAHIVCDLNGGARVNAYAYRDGGLGDDTTSQTSCFYTTDGSCRPVRTVGGVFNGSTAERTRNILAAFAATTNGTGVSAVAIEGGNFANITTATTTTVKSGAGVLTRIVVGTCVANATITLYNNTAASGTKIGTITCPATVVNPFEVAFEVKFGTGLTIVTSGATDLTVSYW